MTSGFGDNRQVENAGKPQVRESDYFFFFAAFFRVAFFLVAFFAVGFDFATVFDFFLVAFFFVVFFFVVFFFAGPPKAEDQPSEYFSFVPTRKIVIVCPVSLCSYARQSVGLQRLCNQRRPRSGERSYVSIYPA